MKVEMKQSVTTTIEIDEKKLFETLYKCESDFSTWVQSKLHSVASPNIVSDDLTAVLADSEFYLNKEMQLIKPIKRWNENKERCYKMGIKSGKSTALKQSELDFLRQTAFDGQVLLLTVCK